MKTKTLILSLLLGLISQLNAQTTSVSASEFKTLIEKKDGILLDTRSQPEYARGHIAGAQLIDLQSADYQSTLLALPKNKTLYLYCFSGARSRSVASFLEQNGYTKIVNLQRGLMDWNRNQFPVETNATPETQQTDAMSIADFKKLTNESTLVFIDYYAPWCAPCKQMMPMIEELKKEYTGKISIVRVNYDASKALMLENKVATVPYLVLYKNAKAVYIKEGAVTKEELNTEFRKHTK